MVSLFLQGVRNRLSSKGVQVITVKPGFVNTPMTAALEKKGLLWAQPDQIAQGIVIAVERGRDEVYLPWFWRWIMLGDPAYPGRNIQTDATIAILFELWKRGTGFQPVN
jgi:short-subunit dehydrogenase